MKNAEQGFVMPFALSGTRLRNSAQAYRRRGQTLEALSLIRRAAYQDDTAPGWLALAAEMRQTGNWEAAAILLSRAAALAEPSPAAWLDMGRCMAAMGLPELMEDCLSHVLTDAPWSPESDAARSMMRSLPEDVTRHGTNRLQHLVRRGMDVWPRDKALGLRRLRRAMRLSSTPVRLMNTVGMLYLMDDQQDQAVNWFGRSLRLDPHDLASMGVMTLLAHYQGRHQAARILLNGLAPLCQEPHEEKRYLDTALALGGLQELEAYLTTRLRLTPYRIPLLHGQASLLQARHQPDEAREVYRLILSIDPDDREAVIALTAQDGEVDVEAIRLRQRDVLTPVPEELFQCGSEARRALDWCAASPDKVEWRLALDTAAAHPDRAGEIRWLLELLTRVDTTEALRVKAVERLNALRPFQPVTAILGGHMVQAKCEILEKSIDRRIWQAFLVGYLLAVRPYGDLTAAAAFVARIWKALSPRDRQDAQANPSPWYNVILALWLTQRGQEEAAQAVLTAIPLPQRRVARLWRRLSNHLQGEAIP